MYGRATRRAAEVSRWNPAPTTHFTNATRRHPQNASSAWTTDWTSLKTNLATRHFQCSSSGFHLRSLLVRAPEDRAARIKGMIHERVIIDASHFHALWTCRIQIQSPKFADWAVSSGPRDRLESVMMDRKQLITFRDNVVDGDRRQPIYEPRPQFLGGAGF